MFYLDSIEESSEYLRLALRHMGSHQLPTDPCNYRIWYEYVSGRNPELKESLDDCLARQVPVTSDLCHELYRNHIDDPAASLSDTINREVRVLLGDILRHTLTAGDHLSQSSTVLGNFARELTGALDTADIERIIAGIINESRRMEQTSATLQQRLEESTSEIEILRNDLEAVRHEATTDALTGLPNRRAFEETLSRAMEQADQAGTPLCLIMADIDHFKRINDTFGHLTGDRVLRICASMIRDCVRGLDFVSRFGGEEFIIMLADTPFEGAMTVAEKIRAHFSATNWKRKDSAETLGTITLSLGVASHLPGESPESFIRRSDKAMYLSKRGGRNQVNTLATDSVTDTPGPEGDPLELTD